MTRSRPRQYQHKCRRSPTERTRAQKVRQTRSQTNKLSNNSGEIIRDNRQRKINNLRIARSCHEFVFCFHRLHDDGAARRGGGRGKGQKRIGASSQSGFRWFLDVRARACVHDYRVSEIGQLASPSSSILYRHFRLESRHRSPLQKPNAMAFRHSRPRCRLAHDHRAHTPDYKYNMPKSKRQNE